MASSLFGSTPRSPQVPTRAGQANAVMGAMRGDMMSVLRLLAQKDPRVAQVMSRLDGMSEQQIAEYGERMMQENTQFADFVRKAQSKGLMQAARDYGLRI